MTIGGQGWGICCWKRWCCAREEGIKRLRAVVLLLDNTPMLRVLQRYGWVLAAPTEDFSVAFLEISAIGGMPGWPAVSAGRRVLVERRGPPAAPGAPAHPVLGTLALLASPGLRTCRNLRPSEGTWIG
jgi:hypothetical protein